MVCTPRKALQPKAAPSCCLACASTCAVSKALSPSLALITNASKPAGPPSCARSNTNWAGSDVLDGSASMGCGSRAPWAWAYTVVMASNRSAWAIFVQSSAATPLSTISRTASVGGQASTTRSNANVLPAVTCQPLPLASMLRTLAPNCTRPPRCCSQFRAASGSSALKSTRGSSRLEPPRLANIESCSTRKNTWPLARSAGVLSADTHSGSINCAITRGGSAWHSAATVCWGGQVKPASCQRVATRSSASLSAHDQPRAQAMPSTASSGAGQRGNFRPRPSGPCRVSGRRSKVAAASTPTSAISCRVSV